MPSINIDEKEWSWQEVWSKKWNCNFWITSHCSIQIGQLLFVLAGKIAFTDNPIYRFNSDIFSIDLQSKELKKLKIKGERPLGRRLSAACSDGVSITLLGGLDDTYKTLGDLWIYSTSRIVLLESQIWTSPLIKESDEQAFQLLEEGIAGHQMVYVSRSASKKERSVGYVFGGYSKNEGESNNMIMIDNLELFSRVNIVQAKGKPPSPRYCHSMTLMHTCNTN